MNKFDEVWYSEARINVKFTKKETATNSDFVEAVKKVVLSYNMDTTILLGLSVRETETDEVKVGKRISNSLTSVTLKLELAIVQSNTSDYFENLSKEISQYESIESAEITEFSGIRTRSLGSAGLQSYSKRFAMSKTSAILVLKVFNHLIHVLNTQEFVEFEGDNNND